MPPRKYAELPSTEVSRAAIPPPVHDSAVATVIPECASNRSRSSNSGLDSERTVNVDTLNDAMQTMFYIAGECITGTPSSGINTACSGKNETTIRSDTGVPAGTETFNRVSSWPAIASSSTTVSIRVLPL
jgi:hypothetical protein